MSGALDLRPMLGRYSEIGILLQAPIARSRRPGRLATQPSPASPASISAQVDGSGTAWIAPNRPERVSPIPGSIGIEPTKASVTGLNALIILSAKLKLPTRRSPANEPKSRRSDSDAPWRRERAAKDRLSGLRVAVLIETRHARLARGRSWPA